MGFPKQEYWSGLPFPSPGDLPDPVIEPTSPAWQVDSLPLSHQGSQRRQILGVGFNLYPATVGCALSYVGNPHSLWGRKKSDTTEQLNTTQPCVLPT